MGWKGSARRTFRALDSEPWITVIGIVPDLRQYGVERESPAQYYTPFLQSPLIAARVLLRTEGNLWIS